MIRSWIVDASPIVSLAWIGQVDLLTKLAGKLAIPRGVAEEVLAVGRDDPARRWIETEGKQHICVVEAIDRRLSWRRLGRGEAEVLTLAAASPDSEAILDDRAARSAARSLGVAVRGTLGLVVLAKREGLISEAKSTLDALIAAGHRVDADLISRAMQLAGE